MALCVFVPRFVALDANGTPDAAATLTIYTAATVTLASIYSDTALTVSITNPMTADAAGRFARAYIAAGEYKCKVTYADATTETFDHIDTGLSSGSGALPVASGGTAGTTAAAARTNLGAAAATDVTSINTTIASISAILQTIASVPQGRLTLTTATPVLSTGVSAATSVYYTPYVGTQIPIYDGTQFNLTTFAELTLSLVASHTASALFDVFVWSESGVVTVGTGPAWTTATAGSGARGSGAGTTELVRTNGLWTNTNSMTTRNGATTYTVAAHKGTYVGSLFMDGTNGQISCHTAYGQSRKFGVWNAYNRKPIFLKAGESTASWAYTVNTFRASNGSATNSLSLFMGLSEESTEMNFIQRAGQTSAGAAVQYQPRNGIGFNSTTVASGKWGNFYFQANYTGTNSGGEGDLFAKYLTVPAIGAHTITALEKSITASSGSTFYGTENDMILSAMWLG